MKKQRAYEPAKGPQQRRRLLKDLAVPRKSGRRMPSYSRPHARKLTGKMFGFEPLVPLDLKRLSLLKRLAIEQNLELLISDAKIARGLLYGTDRGDRYTIGENERQAGRQEVIGLFADARQAQETVLSIASLKGSGGIVRPFFRGTRGLEGYLVEGGMGVLEIAKQIRERQGRKIRFLDVGHHTGRVASELKKELGEEVETHTLSPIETAKFPGVDNYHRLFAEFLPKEFRRHFDVIVSVRALEYSLFPDAGIRNIAEALAPGGRAVINWFPGRFYAGRSSKSKNGMPVAEHVRAFEGIRLTPEGKRIMQRSANVFGSEGSLDEFLRLNGGFFLNQSIAWCNELGRLAADPELKVSFVEHVSDEAGLVPSLVVIERKR
jgi:SAM-dependent methyltransferase